VTLSYVFSKKLEIKIELLFNKRLVVNYKSKSQQRSNLISAALIKKISKIPSGGYMGAIYAPTIAQDFGDILTPI
jgi:hypothetical protein